MREAFGEAAETQPAGVDRLTAWRIEAQALGLRTPQAKDLVKSIANVASDPSAPNRIEAIEALALLQVGTIPESVKPRPRRERASLEPSRNGRSPAEAQAANEDAIAALLASDDPAVRDVAFRALASYGSLTDNAKADLQAARDSKKLSSDEQLRATASCSPRRRTTVRSPEREEVLAALKSGDSARR